MSAELAVALFAVAIGAGICFFVVLISRVRRRGGAYRAGLIGATYEWYSQDKRRAMEVVVEQRAEEQTPEHPDGSLPDLEHPRKD